jgi:hypothetical protein
MRLALFTAAAALAAGAMTTAHAAPAAVDVTVGPELMAKAEKTYGVRDVHELAEDLQKDVSNRLARSAAFDGARIELVIADAAPNRPTFKQLGDTPSLSVHSVSTGGAAIEGRIVSADGKVRPVHYRYFSHDLGDALTTTTWADARRSLGRFAYELGRGQLLASR